MLLFSISCYLPFFIIILIKTKLTKRKDIKMKYLISTILLLYFSIFLSCTGKNNSTLVFFANGEEFIKDGFVSKDGWKLKFDTVIVNISNPFAYNNNLSASLKGNFAINLVTNNNEAGLKRIGEVNMLGSGNYKSLKFGISKISSGEFKGYSIILKGNASKDSINKTFLIKLNEEILFDGKEGYVGDIPRGILKSNDTANLELTFHFDHIFGDFNSPLTEHVNTGSVGFEFFNQFSSDSNIVISQDELLKDKNYKILVDGIKTLGHLGEGHCEAIKL